MNRFHRWYCRSDRWASTLRDRLMPWVLPDLDLGDDVLEVGPGPGLTTDRLAAVVPRLTAIEVDAAAAAALRGRTAGRVDVVTGDATAMPFEDRRFSGAVSFTMLHHVPSPELQDRLLAEVHRVLRPGGVFAGSDSTTSLLFRIAHLRDTMVLVDPDTFGERLAAAGFDRVRVQRADGAFRFSCRRPQPGAATDA
jgi:SAM-dependent methyltransferase